MRYEIIQYESVEMTSDGLWAINESNRTGVYLTLNENSEPRDICQFLKKSAFIESANMRTLYVTDMASSIIEVKFKKDKKPICRLERKSI